MALMHPPSTRAQIAAIAWAQLRTMRNHLPRTSAGAVLVWFAGAVWYGLYGGLAVLLVLILPLARLAEIRSWLPLALLGMFLFWQLLPLFTLSAGWSLQLNKLRMYPVSDSALFGIEVLLRLTTSPEMLLVLLGGMVGLARHPGIPLLAACSLLLYIPFNLLLSLAIRETFLQAFNRGRLRELLAILLIAFALLPQILVRTALRTHHTRELVMISQWRGTPWRELAILASGTLSWLALALLVLWTAVAWLLARRQFGRAMCLEESYGGPGSAEIAAAARKPDTRFSLFNRLFRDPIAAVLQKEFQTLLRMPRFRISFGMACIFSVIVFLPASMGGPHRGQGFIDGNFLVIVDLYGLLLLSDNLFLNVLGMDRAAVQLYFAAPVPFRSVLRAKNIAALIFVIAQNAIVLLFAAALRLPLTRMGILEAAGASAVASVFFLAAGNLCSVAMPRPADPRQTFRKNAGAQMQLWSLCCSLGLLAVIGFAFLARWAFESDWAFIGILGFELAVAVLFYKFATDSAVSLALSRRETILSLLSKGASPVALGG